MTQTASADFAAAPNWSLFEVTVTDGGYTSTSTYSAPTRARAVYQAFLSYSDVWTISFRAFLSMVRARRVSTCANDGYGYVRRAYGLDPQIGAEIELINEGDWFGRRGRIVHPGKSSTAYVHVAVAGINYALTCHPNSIRMIGEQA